MATNTFDDWIGDAASVEWVPYPDFPLVLSVADREQARKVGMVFAKRKDLTMKQIEELCELERKLHGDGQHLPCDWEVIALQAQYGDVGAAVRLAESRLKDHSQWARYLV